MHCFSRREGSSFLKESHARKETVIVLKGEKFLSIFVPFSPVVEGAEVFFVCDGFIFVEFNIFIRRENTSASIRLMRQQGLGTNETVG